MLDALAQRIRARDPMVREVFGPGFHSPGQWVDYLGRHFGGASPSVSRILDRGTAGWSTEDFHALYVACWIFQPVEKGTYMIRLTNAQRAGVRSGYEGLGLRWTSHLHEHGRSASAGWEFLKGYHELLVQMEGGGKKTPGFDTPYLFLKCEGHKATHPAHLKSFITKLRTGAGDVANPYLSNIAREKASLGIASRAAENYSGKYEKLLKALGFSGKVTTVQQAFSRLWTRCLEIALKSRTTLGMPMMDVVNRLCTQAGFSVRTELDRLSNKDLAKFLGSVIIPLADALPASKEAEKLKKAMDAAKADLREIMEKLATDAERTGEEQSQRFFMEILVEPRVLDDALKVFRQQLALGAIA